MHLNPYGTDAVRLAVDLASQPPADPAELADVCSRHGVVVDRRVTSTDVHLVAEVMERWLGVVDATDEDKRARLLNELTASYAAYPRLTNHVGTGWHVHYRPDSLPVGKVVAALVSVGTLLHLAGRGMHRLGRCAADGCDLVYADLSRGGTQQYCSPACANRSAVRRHRSRRTT